MERWGDGGGGGGGNNTVSTITEWFSCARH